MRTTITAIFLGTLLCVPGIAQTSPTAAGSEAGGSQAPPSPAAAQPASAGTKPAASNQGLKIAPGSVIPVQLAKTVDAKKAKTGDEVIAIVTMDMKTNAGDVLVPKDTKILGHVTQAQARNKEQKESELGIAFDHAVVKGDQVQLPMSIQAVIAPQPANPAPDAGGTGGAPSGSNSTSPMAGRPPLSGSSPSSQPPQNYPAGGGPSDSQPQTNARPPITGNTQGVIGMPDVKLESGGQRPAQGSVMTSEKSTVKIEKGTMLLLRVSQ